MLIRNYGLFWRLDEVDWKPGRGNVFELLGRRGKNNPNLLIADFRDQNGIYILYGNYGPHYVGLTMGLGFGERLKNHLTNDHGGQWDRFSWFGFKKVLKRKDKDYIRQLGKLPGNRYVGMRYSIRDTEALLIKAMGLSNINEMNFTNAQEWTHVKAHEIVEYLKKVKKKKKKKKKKRK